jgi:hypothetical protein
VQPAGGPAAGELELGLAPAAVLRELDGRQQELLHRALHGADGDALLHHAVGGDLVEAVKGVDEAGGGAGAFAALAGELDGRGDVVRLEQRPAQRLQLGEVVLAMAAGRASRLRVAESPLPGAQRVRAHSEELGGRVCPNPTHLALSLSAIQCNF